MNREERIRIFRENMQPICSDEFVDRLRIEGYFDAPAGMKHHGAYEGALFDHSMFVAAELQDQTNKHKLTWMRPEGPMIVGFLHDLCKIKQYRKVVDRIVLSPLHEEEYRYEWEKNQDLPGHGETSILRIMEYGGPQLMADELFCIRYHMGAYAGEKEWTALDIAIRKYPNILYTHMADMIVAKLRGI